MTFLLEGPGVVSVAVALLPVVIGEPELPVPIEAGQWKIWFWWQLIRNP